MSRGFVAPGSGRAACDAYPRGARPARLLPRRVLAAWRPFHEAAQWHNCTECVAGKASRPGLSACVDCNAGRWKSWIEPCIECGTGSFQTSVRVPYDLCPAGLWRLEVGAACDAAPGRRAGTLAMSACTDCVAGRFTKQPNSTNCTECGWESWSMCYPCIQYSWAVFQHVWGLGVHGVCPGEFQPIFLIPELQALCAWDCYELECWHRAQYVRLGSMPGLRNRKVRYVLEGLFQDTSGAAL